MVSCKMAILLLHYYCNNPLSPFSEKIINNRFMKPHTYRISEIKDTIGSHVFHWSAITLVVIFSLIAPFVAYCDDGKKISSYTLSENLSLAILMVILLAYLFYLVFRWSQRNEQASYLGVVYQDTVFEFEFGRRKARVDKKRREGEYRRQALSQDDPLQKNFGKNPPSLKPELRIYIKRRRSTGSGGLITTPPGLESSDKDGYTTIRDGGSTNPFAESESYVIDLAEMTDEERSLYEQYKTDYGNYRKEQDELYQRLASLEEELYQKELDVARKKAEAAAKLAADVDISIFRGRGPTFVLEFTAIVVIIFSAVILGIIRILGAEQIGTLLAAVAGYVLGRSTSRGSDGERSAKTESEPSNNHAGDTAKE